MHIKKLVKYFLIAVAAIILFADYTAAQTAFVQQLRQQFTQYQSRAFTEKIYLHADRNFYMTGEIIWFKAYVVDGTAGFPSDISKVAYVDIIDRDNKPVLQAKIALKMGSGSGSFYIPVNLLSGNYKLRAYTNWMKNFDASYYFEKPISIANTLADTGLPPADSLALVDLQFFPEGGNLVKNMPCRMAFRMTNRNGKGVADFSGVVIDETQDTILHFAPMHAGIGSFIFTALPGHHYTAVINRKDSVLLKKPMPEALPDGYSLSLTTPSAGKIMIAVQANVPESAKNEVYLFAHTKGAVKLAEVRKLQSGKTIFNLDESQLGDGVTHFTLFSGDRQPVCERLYFKRPGAPLKLSAKTNMPEYPTRQKITVQITSNNATGESEAADMSLSVYRIDSLQADEAFDMYSYLWLAADLKGTIENPSYYFRNDDEKTMEALDNVMLTHGWRKFKWKDIQENRLPAFTLLPEYEGHIVTGKITDTLSKSPIPETTVYLSFPGEHTQFYSDRSGADGALRFYTRDVYGPGELIAQAEGLRDTKYNIEINTPFSDKFSERRLPVLSLSPTLKDALASNSIAAQVQRKYAAERLRQYSLPQADTTPFYGNADENYLLDDYTRFTTMEEVLREYVMGITVGRSGGKFHLNALDIPNNRLFRDNPLVLLDGVPILDMDQVLAYDPLKVRRLQVVKRRYYYGQLLLDGILNMTTYKGNMEAFQIDPAAIVLDFDGMQLQREFYMPVYDTPEQRHSHMADFRNLLYWSPAVTTGKDGKTEITIYSSDLTGKYIGVLEGLAADGKAGSAKFTFEVTQGKD